MCGDEIDVGGELRIVAPDVPDFARRDRNVDRLLDRCLISVDEVRFDLSARRGYIGVSLPTTMPIDLLLRLGEIDRGARSRDRCGSASLSIQAPTVTFRPNSAAMGGTSSVAFRRGVEADRFRDRGELLQVGANLFGIGGDVD